MSRVRVCFLGTPEFAATCLQRVLDDEHYEVVGVVTQPDRPAGRKMVMTPSPVKVLANSVGLEVLSPEKINVDEVLSRIQSWNAEVAIVVAFGQILSQRFLDLFLRGAVNVHASLLPRWRGAAPIQRSIEAGDLETGIALQKIVKALDAGDVIGVRKIAIPLEMNSLELYDKLAVLGGDTLQVDLMDYLRGNLAPVPQDHSLATYAKKIDKTEAELNWSLSAEVLHNKIRALTWGPGTWTTFAGKKLKIHRSHLSPIALPGDAGLVTIAEGRLFVATGSGALEILEAQPESRNKLKAADLIRSLNLKTGVTFGLSNPSSAS